MSKNIWIIGIILIILIGGYIYVAKAPKQTPTALNPAPDSTASPTTSATPPPSLLPPVDTGDASKIEPKSTGEAPKPADAQQGFTVEGSEFAFSPKVLTVSAGQKVRVTFINKGAVSHNFVIDGVINGPVISGGSKTVITFSAPDKAGAYPMYCSVGSHRSLGMEGQLVVK